MEKGFNDEELADIMSEIENLEREFAEPSSEESASVEPAYEEPDAEETAVLHELVQKPVAETVLKTHHEETKVLAKKHAPSNAPATMSFKVEGQMSVELSFDVNGQSVSLSVTEEGLSITTDSGAKFTLPMTKHEATKKAA